MNLLFDFMMGKTRRKPKPAQRARPANAAPPARAASQRRTKARRATPSRQAQYEALVAEMTAKHGVRVRRWRKSMSGVAWLIRMRDGSVKKLIESPRPTGPVSCGIFLHEIAHHAIGLGVYKPRCLEEHLAWEWALREMRERGLTISAALERRVERSMRYAVGKAVRRGIKRLPPEVARYA